MNKDRKEYLKKYRLSHKDKYREYNRKWKETHLTTYQRLKQENKELHNKIDKTIKYLETNGYGYDCCGDMCYFLDEDNQKDLFEILKGDVDE